MKPMFVLRVLLPVPHMMTLEKSERPWAYQAPYVNTKCTFASGSEMSEIVCTIDQQIGIVLFGDSLVILQVRGIGIHREKSLCDD